MKFCNLCSSMFSSIGNLAMLLTERGYSYHNLQSLKASALHGCALCSYIQQELGLLYHEDENPGFTCRVQFDYWVDSEDEGEDGGDGASRPHPFHQLVNGFQVLVHEKSPSGDSSGSSLVSFLAVCPSGWGSHISAIEDAAARYVTNRPVPLDPRSIENETKIKAWLQEDTNDEAQQARAKPNLSLPTRVIDVDQLCLHVSSPEETGEYACLSYCWGGPQEVLTTRANLESNKTALPFHSLPPTLQDAIHVTRTLGMRYLWIDALCIVQDSAADKAVEITKMGSIYQNASVTIAAARAAKVSEGFLHPRPADDGFKLPFYVDPETAGHVTLLPMEDAFKPTDPLSMRAWVLQETLLSRRQIVYSEREIIWRTQGNQYQTVVASPRSYASVMEDIPMNLFSPAHRAEFPSAREFTASCIASWSAIVTDFTQRGITVADDRLPAISGVAAVLQRSWKDRYVVGMWESTLAMHLAWRSTDGSLARPPQYRAPSWSWAAVDAPVKFMEVESSHVEILSCEVEPQSPLAPLGSAKSGQLHVRAKLIATADMPLSLQHEYEWKLLFDTKSDSLDPGLTYFMLIGFQFGYRAIGLIIREIADEAFERKGLFYHRDDSVPGVSNSDIWTRPQVVTKDIKIL
ncbi:hypothetical protein BP6252_10364 [Coleophoma cylindrospora]|uniref:Heterokaryon incompatibility domain-containing protein n=1 Tax=Coleophoma cylindrospora TaxID=1849047 RepID=A0A3D8QSB3_9HELO|nr:hypothetical protein BP6252_10364 [Coleophoma cylindrospora]